MYSRIWWLSMAAVLAIVGAAEAKMSGSCSNCHTMHNSQNNQSMATYGGSSGPFPYLTRGSCLGCHGQIAANVSVVAIEGSFIPQVLHNAADDLAGGNFAYILGNKGGGAADAKGHNVIELGNNEDVLTAPPGQFHDHGITNTNFTCAGTKGCHGDRSAVDAFSALKGAHHGNVDGQLASADTVANSYRFLDGVRGYENQVDKWKNLSPTSHNEYAGATTPMDFNTGSCGTCHAPPNAKAKPANGTISGFCTTCHGNFHLLQTIGGAITSPFIRHPTDIRINSRGPASEYAAYVNYKVQVPVGRTTIPASPGSTVDPAADTVTCLSCHYAHASDYPDMLRWDYDKMVSGAAEAAYKDTGCFTCHSAKDGE